MPYSEDEKRHIHQSMYGMPTSVIDQMVEDYMGTPAMLAVSLLSDAQHLMAELNDVERARQTINQAKHVIAENFPMHPAELEPAETVYRLASSTFVHAPGVIAWAIYGYAFEDCREHVIKVMDTWDIPKHAKHALLSGDAEYTIENATVVFTA